MQTRRLGADGPLISAIGIGAMSFSDFYGATMKRSPMPFCRRRLTKV